MARRASLEDDLATISDVEGLDFGDLVGAENLADVKTAIRRLASMASGQLQIQKEMRELEDRLGLNPKAMTALRWKIAEDEVAAARERSEPQAPRSRRLKAVDSAAS